MHYTQGLKIIFRKHFTANIASFQVYIHYNKLHARKINKNKKNVHENRKYY